MEPWEMLTALEGLFVEISAHVDAGETCSWKWSSLRPKLMLALQKVEQSVTHGMLIKTFVSAAKDASDHVRKKTGNKVWNAKWTDRIADMIAGIRRTWDKSTME
eukprot:2946167-Karenia_brevis.AAC.1